MTFDEAQDELEAILKHKRESIAYASPELQDFHWGHLREELADLLERAMDGHPS